jgi:pimeloyl-ACP methyl ester carboxylesterase
MENNIFSAQNQNVEIGGNKIAYRVFGQGEPILFYNRFRGILDTWDPLFLDNISQKHRVILFDYPGIGDSLGELPMDMNEVAQVGVSLLDHLGIDKFFVAGWSYGGQVAQAAMFQNQDRVLKGVFIGTNPPGQNDVPFDKAFFEKALIPVNSLEDEYTLFFEPASEKSKLAANASHERIAKRLDRSKIPATKEIFQRYFAGAGLLKEDAFGYREQYKTLDIPVLVISGDHDISYAVENWFPLLRNAPTMQHIILNDAGHGPHHQEPELMAGYINLFLNCQI